MLIIGFGEKLHGAKILGMKKGSFSLNLFQKLMLVLFTKKELFKIHGMNCTTTIVIA